MAAEFLSGNRLTLLNSGAEYFPALIAAIDKAQHEVHLESYIFEDDATGRAVAAAMANAARRGVTVRVLVDGFGAPEFADRNCSRGWSRPVCRRWSTDPRSHVYACVVIACVACTASWPWWMEKSPSLAASTSSMTAIVRIEMPPRYDYAVRIEGPLLHADSAGAAQALGTGAVGETQSPLPAAEISSPGTESTWRANGSLSGARQHPPPP
jgi:cardiolipin synthase